MSLKILAVLFACIVFSGCGLFEPPGPQSDIEELLSAPEKIDINGREYILETILWRDFMPICPPDGRPLIAIILITATDGLPFPASVNADIIYVVNDLLVWEAHLSEDPSPPCGEHQLKMGARNGPKWGPKIYVDVVVRIVVDENKSCYLRASDQWIGRTD